MQNESLDARGTDGNVLRVEFRWLGDRFGHVLSAVDSAGQSQPLLESLEGTPADVWPPSPPLQNLHRETLPDGRTALLLVGAAGRSHWSASIEAARGEAKLLFDIACRHGTASGWLGSRYIARAAGWPTIQSEESQTTWTGGEVAIEPVQKSSSPTSRWQFAVALEV